MTPNNIVPESNAVARRDFLSKGPLLGGACLAAAVEAGAQVSDPGRERMKPIEASDFIYTACLQCNTGCEIKVRVQDGLAV